MAKETYPEKSGSGYQRKAQEEQRALFEILRALLTQEQKPKVKARETKKTKLKPGK